MIGKTLSHYRIVEKLGAGGMGEVYRAEDTKLKRSVVLKRMAPHLRTDVQYCQRFQKEAERASCLSDPHIVAVYDIFEEDGEPFLVMEYVEGATLRQCLKDTMSLDRFLPVALQCAEALAAAAEKGIMHRDIKPENIMLSPTGQVKVLDFGVARRLFSNQGSDVTTSLPTSRGILIGTPAYMAPEVLQEKEADTRADVFSLGVVFYETLAGRHPFLASTFVATIDRILHEDPARLGQLNPEVPADLEAIVDRMLAKDPDGRYSTPAALLSDLRAFAQAAPSAAAIERRPRRRWRFAAQVGIFMAIAILATMGITRWFREPATLPERGSILVADFQNQTPEKLFDNTISPLLSQSLLQSRYVNVVQRIQVLEAAKRTGLTDVATVDPGLGREICLREGYRALLTGKIISSGSGYQLAVQVVNPTQGLPVITETQYILSPADLYAGVDKLAQRLRRRLGESLAQIGVGSKPLARVTTSSLEALQRYSRALDLFAQRDFAGSASLAESAVEKDPSFAMAHFLLARDYDALGNDKSALQHLTAAKQGSERVTERERHLILALDYSVHDLEQEAMEQYRLLLELDPNDIEALRGLATSAFWTGRVDDAIKAARKAVQVNPFSANEYTWLMQYLIRASRFHEALATYSEARARKVENSQLHLSTGLAYWGLGDLGTARREFELLSRGGETYEENLSQLYLSRLLTYQGRMREAGEALREGLALDQKQQSEAWIPVRLYLLARAALIRGRLKEAAAELEKLRTVTLSLGANSPAGPAPENLHRAGWLAIQLQDLNSARSFLALLEKHRSPGGKTYTECYYLSLKGDIELATGNPAAAIESLRRALLLLRLQEPCVSLGQACAAQKDWSGAIQAYQQYLNLRGRILRDDFAGAWVLTHLQLARMSVLAGDTQQALRYYDEFLRLWASADADLPALQQAHEERKKLVLGDIRTSAAKK